MTVSLRIRGDRAGFGFATRDTPGTLSLTNFVFTLKERRRVRADVGPAPAGGRSAISDFKGNRRTVVRTVRLTR